MNVSSARVGAPRRYFAGSNALALILALTLFLQGMVTQTHIHGATFSHGLSALLAKISVGVEAPSGGKHKAPNDDEARCPLCQAAQHAGSFVAPAAIVLLLPWQNISLVPLVLENKTHINPASHDWRGRAPPSA
jgi:hypothetical protein